MTESTEAPGTSMAVSRVSGKRKATPWLTILLLTAPFIIVYIAFLIYPTIRVIMLSFTDADIAGKGSYIGTANYLRLVKDPLFWSSLWHTIYFILLTVVPNTALGLIFALMIVRLKRWRGTITALLFLPYILPVSVVTEIWLWILSSAVRNSQLFIRIEDQLVPGSHVGDAGGGLRDYLVDRGLQHSSFYRRAGSDTSRAL